jgi:hypothetical protein
VIGTYACYLHDVREKDRLGRETGGVIDDLPAALARYAQRLHACVEDSHHVVSPLGAWLVLALCGPLGEGDPGRELAEVLGMEPAEASKVAEALLDSLHPLVAAGAGVWARPGAATTALRRWLADLPLSVDRGEVPSPSELDAWAKDRTLGLIEQFPLDLGPDVVLVLATALATKVSWEKPFDVVDAAELGPTSVWSTTLKRALRAPLRDPRHHQYIVDTPRAGMVGVHLATARGGLLVGSVIAADPAVPAADVLAAADQIVTAEARQLRSVTGRSLFDLPLGDGTVWSIVEETVETTVHTGHEERIVSVLPAWSATTKVSLADEQLGFLAAARALAAAMDLPQFTYAAAQSAVARYTALGFEAAAVTGLAVAASAAIARTGLRRTATVRFGHPYAVVAAAYTDRSSAEPPPGQAWHGLPVFSAWVSDPSDAEPVSRP